MPRLTIMLLGLLIFSLAPGTVSAQARADGQYFGTWKLNLAKSNYYGRPMPKEYWMIVEDRGCGMYYSIVKGTGADGQELMTQYVGRFDKKDYPMLQVRSATWGSVVNWLHEPYVTKFTTKQNGKAVTNGTRKVSKDGNIAVVEMTDLQGKPTTLLWWERVKVTG